MEEKFKYWKANTKRNASSISKIKVSLKYPPNNGEYSEIKVHSKINEILNIFSAYNKKSKSTAAKLIKGENSKNAKENIILLLREDLEYHKKINESYLAYEKYAEDLCKTYKKNFDDIFIYKKDLTEDLKDFIILLKNFEENKIELCKEKKLIKQSNEDILKYKLEEQKNLNNKIIKLSDDLEKQSVILKDLNAILKTNLSMNQNNLMDLQNEELRYKDKLEIMENAYKKLIYRYNYYQDMTVLERKKKFAGENSYINKEETDEASIKLKEEVIKNNYLKKEIDALKNKMKEFEKLDASKFRKFRFNMTKDNKERKGSKERTGSKESKESKKSKESKESRESKENKDISIDGKSTYSKFTDTKLNLSSNF